MTTWDYRVVRYENGMYGLHEVGYDEDGNIEDRTAEPVQQTEFTSVECLKDDINAMLEAFDKPIIDDTNGEEEADEEPRYVINLYAGQVDYPVNTYTSKTTGKVLRCLRDLFDNKDSGVGRVVVIDMDRASARDVHDATLGQSPMEL